MLSVNEALRRAMKTRGLALPSVAGSGGVLGGRNRYEVAWSDLSIALLTPKGSVPMDRTRGSTLRSLIFSGDAEPVIPLIKQVVIDVASTRCPNVTILDVTCRPDGDKTVGVAIRFKLAGDNTEPDSRILQVNRATE